MQKFKSALVKEKHTSYKKNLCEDMMKENEKLKEKLEAMIATYALLPSYKQEGEQVKRN